jgi:site-specific recombinase XerD
MDRLYWAHIDFLEGLSLTENEQLQQLGRQFSQTAVENWIARSLSPATQLSYRVVVKDFAAFLGRPVVEAVPDDVRCWRDRMVKAGKKPATVAHRLAVLRSLFRYLLADGFVARNPAVTELVPPPSLPDEQVGRALTPKQVMYLLAGPRRMGLDEARKLRTPPDQRIVAGCRDYAILLVLARLGVRVAEACSLKVSSVQTARERVVLHVRVKGGRERQLPLPDDVQTAIDVYLHLDRWRRRIVHSDKRDDPLFQPLVNYRTLEQGKALSTRHVRQLVGRYAELAGIGKLSPHDLRRTFVTVARDQGLSTRQIQMATGHKDGRMIDRYDRGRENLDLNAINFIRFEEDG